MFCCLTKHTKFFSSSQNSWQSFFNGFEPYQIFYRDEPCFFPPHTYTPREFEGEWDGEISLSRGGRCPQRGRRSAHPSTIRGETPSYQNQFEGLHFDVPYFPPSAFMSIPSFLNLFLYFCWFCYFIFLCFPVLLFMESGVELGSPHTCSKHGHTSPKGCLTTGGGGYSVISNNKV